MGRRGAGTRLGPVFLPPPPQPDLAPVLVDGAWAVLVPVGEADEPLEHDAVAGDVDHLAGRVVDDPGHPAGDPGPAAAVAQRLGVEAQAAVLLVAVEGGEYLLPGLDLDQLAHLEVEDLLWRAAGGDLAVDERVVGAAVDPQPPG